jgi:hypothetical protein
MFTFPQPHYMPCAECGASLARAETEGHVCGDERRLDYEVIQLRAEVDEFELQLASYLQTLQGRFEVWYAANRR